MTVLTNLTQRLAAGETLSNSDIRLAVADLVNSEISAETKADFLAALSKKGETVEEIAGFARELRQRSVRPEVPERLREEEILDIVGTGGDRLSTFNISTCVSLLSAAAGVRVAKHGNRASTSPVGSADVMESLGLPYDLEPETAVEHLEKHRFCFLFAPRYHPAFKHIIPARKLCAQRGQVTIFNLLGPLLNPILPTAALIGVARPELCEPMARVLQSLGVRRGMVVSGATSRDPEPPKYLDEISPLGPTTVAEFYHDKGFAVSTLDPAIFPIQPMSLSDLRGGGGEINANIIRDILSGRETGPKRDAVLTNASAALFVAGAARTLMEGWEIAAEIIKTGQADRKLRDLAGSKASLTVTT